MCPARIRLAALEVTLEELRSPSPQTVAPKQDLADTFPEWLTVDECARALGIRRGLVYELVRRGELKPTRRFGRLIRVHRDALTANAVSTESAHRGT
jgi:excisionase family DNA binding protein